MYGLEGKGYIPQKEGFKSAYIKHTFLNCGTLCIVDSFGTLAWTRSAHWGEFNIDNVLSSECFELYKYSIRD